MRYTTTDEFQNDVNKYIQYAAKEPVTIKDEGKDMVVMIPAYEYFRREEREKKELMDFLKFRDECAREASENGLTQEILEDILNDKR